jgi:hypothetical protein
MGRERRTNERHDAADQAVVYSQAVHVGMGERVEVKGSHSVCALAGVKELHDFAT